MIVEAYKIKDKTTGLFSTGGSSVKWTKDGKAWSAKQYVDSHINLQRRITRYNKVLFPYNENCVIVKLIMQTSEENEEHIEGY